MLSKTDLVQGYHQMPAHPDDIQKTAVNTPFSFWEFLWMPLGLRNTAQTSQH